MASILILGAGFGGLEVATRLSEALDDRYDITLVDRKDGFYVGFSKIEVLFGRKTPEEVTFPYEFLRADRVRFVRDTVVEIDTDARRVRTMGRELGYDYLVVALGAHLDPEATPGFIESGGYEFYSMEGAAKLAPVIQEFSAGTLVIGILGLPYMCPPAPYEGACQMHALFEERGLRDAITMKMVIPGARPVPNPAASDGLEAQLARRNIELIAEAPIDSIAAGSKILHTSRGEVPFDLFVGVPVHVPPPVVAASNISDGGFVSVDLRTLETSVPNVYAVGDVTHIPVADKVVPKAGAFAEDAAGTVASDILRKEGFATETVPFKARGACYAEFGAGEVARIEADFLGSDQPRMAFLAPSPERQRDKVRFESERRERWFQM